MFSITPETVEGEAPISYLLRLALRHGFTAMHRLFTKPTIARVVKGIDSKEAALNGLLPPTDIPHFLHSAFFRIPRALHPRICVHCIAKHGVLKEAWHNPFVLNCSEHHTELVSRCPHCDQLLQWDIPLLSGLCTNPRCAKRLTNKPATLSLSDEQASDCLMAAYMLETDCPVLSHYKYYPPIEDISRAIHIGHTLLSNQAVALDWMTKIIAKVATIYPTSIAKSRLKDFRNTLSQQWPIHGVEIPVNVMRNQASTPYITDAGSASVFMDVSDTTLNKLAQ